VAQHLQLHIQTQEDKNNQKYHKNSNIWHLKLQPTAIIKIKMEKLAKKTWLDRGL